MTEYVDRIDAIKAVTGARLPDKTPDGIPIANGKRSVADCVFRIKKIPTADVVPVLHGKWIVPDPDSDEQVYCSVCGWHVYGDLFTPHCPGCGARMDGDI